MSKFVNEGTLKLFDAGFPSSSMSLLTGSNIYNLGGYNSGSSQNNDIEAVSYNCVWAGQLVNAVARLQDYRMYDLVKTVLRLFSDAVNGVIDYDAKDLIFIEGEEELTEKVNESFREINYLDHMKSILNDFIYYTSFCAALTYEGGKLRLRDLKYPYTSMIYKPDKKLIVFSDDGPQFLPHYIRFAQDDMNLMIDDIIFTKLGLYNDTDLKKLRSDKKSIYSLPRVLANEPLFLSSEIRLKDYILKDMISSYLSIMDMIQQDTFTIDANRISDTVNLIKLCERIKGLLVTKDDMNLLASARLDRTALIRRLFDRVRVIPSIAGALQGMQKLEGTNLADKLNSLATQKDSVREDLLNNIGFPIDLFRGNTTRWEAGRQNDRYNINVLNFKNGLVTSTINNAKEIIRIKELMVSEKDIEALKIKVVFIEKTPYEIRNITEKKNLKKEDIQSTQDIIRTGLELTQQEGIDNVDEVRKAINTQFQECGIIARLKVESPKGDSERGNGEEEVTERVSERFPLPNPDEGFKL